MVRSRLILTVLLSSGLLLTVLLLCLLPHISPESKDSETALPEEPPIGSRIQIDLSLKPSRDAAITLNAPSGDEYKTNLEAYYVSKKCNVLWERTRALSVNNRCFYGLYEIGTIKLAIFFANTETASEAEALSHLLLCYRDYFPILLLGNHSEKSATMLCNIVNLDKTFDSSSAVFSANVLLNKLGLERYGITVTPPRLVLDLSSPMIALTYDDGPGIYTPTVLRALDEADAKATFYVLGVQAEAHREMLQAMHRIGCEIGNHTNLHEVFSENTPAIIRKTIEDTDRKIRLAVGIGSATVRPPTGAIHDRGGNPVTLGCPIVLWSLDTKDYTERLNANELSSFIASSVCDGSIVLMHDTHAETANATASCIKELRDCGIQTVTVSELIEFRFGGIADAVFYGTKVTN